METNSRKGLGVEDEVATTNTQPSSVVIDVLAAVIHRDGRYLVGLRPDNKRHGALWEFPGGKVADGESWADTASRELNEELGVEVVRIGRLLTEVFDPGSVYRVCFFDVEIRGDPQNHEHNELRWVRPDDLANLPLAPADRAFALTLEP